MNHGSAGLPAGGSETPEVIRVDLALRAGRLEPDFPSLMRRRGALGEPLVPDEVGLAPFLVFRRAGAFRLDVHPPSGYRVKTEGMPGAPWLRWSALGAEWRETPPDPFRGGSLEHGTLRLHWSGPESLQVAEAWVCQLGLVASTAPEQELRAVIGLANHAPEPRTQGGVPGAATATGDRRDRRS